MHRIVRPSPALLVSLVALVIAMGGTGWAASSSLPAWHALTPINGWAYGGYGTYHPAYYKDSAGVVHLRGSLTCGSCGVIQAFKLPRGARPKANVYIEIFGMSGCPGALQIEPDGIASVYDDSGGSGCAETFASLDNVSFPTN